MAKSSYTIISTSRLKDVKVSPRKARLVLDMIRGKQVEDALVMLQFSKKKSSEIVKKALESAISNARNRYDVDVDELYVVQASADMGKTFKRFLPRAQGRASTIRKKHAHIDLAVGY